MSCTVNGAAKLIINTSYAIGGVSDYVTFGTDGSMTYTGNAKLNRSTGWADILPADASGDGTNSAAFTVITGNRFGYEFPGTGAFKQRMYKYHIPHDIALTPTNYYFHLHWEHNTTNPAGNAVFTLLYASALRDGAFSVEATQTITVTPSNANKNSNMVIEIELTAQIENLKPDAMYHVYLKRDSADVNDTFTGSIWVHTADLHALHDGKMTTSKDVGTGWVKVNV